MTIQRYLLIVILSVVVLSTFSAALNGYKASNEKLNSIFDEEMQSIALALKNNAIRSTIDGVDTKSAFAFQIWHKNAITSRSKNAPIEFIATQDSGYGYSNFSGTRWRTYRHNHENTTVIVAQPVNQRIESIESVLLEAVLPIVYVIPIIGILIFLAVKSSLKPLHQLSTQVRIKDSTDLSPIHINENSEELAPVEKTINELLARLKSAFAREQSLASNAAHELRTPVSVLKLNAHNIKVAFESNSITPDHIKELAKNTSRMAHVIEQVIALNRTTPENFESNKSTFNLVKILQEVIANNFEYIESRNQTIALEGTEVQVLADRFAIETLFENLIRNAAKYGGKNAEISVAAYSDERYVICTVEDSGPGIDEDKLEKVFQRFYRIKQHEETGSGLGFSIVKHIVDLHNGEIQLGRSALGGLKVIIRLPNCEEGTIL